ncbi:MAG TPA: hypothetical protein PK466_01045 [Thermotogota bacterium]|nr:hypothetical protein [Thermotogota bacterium]HPJ87674.1 hypothetical protein [Thermotogota bacterium]HPR94887.1 hypothetical protein [Thermotogota bacterium]
MINTYNEKSLHADIKAFLSKTGDEFECSYNGFIIDIKRNDLLIEIQTKNFLAMRKKLSRLLDCNRIRLVHPIIKNKKITVLETDGTTIKHSRYSPKHGDITDIFEEILYIPELVSHMNLEIQILLISAEEIRIDDGKGSWRRKGISIADRKLIEVHDDMLLNHPVQLFKLLPESIQTEEFSTRDLSEMMKITKQKASKICYTLKKIGLIIPVSKQGNLIIYRRL